LVVTAALISDGVLLLSFVERLRAGGMPVREALVQASRLRFRPRIMTTLTTVVGFLPLALNWAGGGEMLQPMAIAAIGGLLIEIPAVLYVVPCLYLIGRK
ncbi:MAG: efflux RND transporter permease subunit, partial [Candidatus Latescibacteria bacterium]|nr:efflux RND transporter permease subunit [Candidatus Latescibacterota bacterium]